MGLGWDKKPGAGFIGTGAPDVDLDASAVQYAGEQLFDLAFFNHLETRDGSVTHLGDNISGRGDGDDEQITIDLAAVQSDIVIFRLHDEHWTPQRFASALAERGVLVGAMGSGRIRAVTHYGIDTGDIEEALEIIRTALAS